MITLKTLPSATQWQVKQQIEQHLRKQGRKSAPPTQVGNSGCLYRYQDGDVTLKCAAGCLIGDDEYDTSFECKSWQRLANRCAVPQEHVELITRYQSIHDRADPRYWNELFRLVDDAVKLEQRLDEITYGAKSNPPQ